MFCETFSDEGSGCEDLNLQCNSVSAPAGYFILHSFENIFAVSIALTWIPAVPYWLTLSQDAL